MDLEPTAIFIYMAIFIIRIKKVTSELEIKPCNAGNFTNTQFMDPK